MSRLSWKIAGAFILVVMVSVGLMAYLTSQSTTREFRTYIVGVNILYAQDAADTLSQFYTQEQSWNNVQSQLVGLSRCRKDRLIVADSSNVVVGDTANEWQGTATDEIGLSDGIPIIAGGQYVGELYWFAYGTMMCNERAMEHGGTILPVLDMEGRNFLSGVFHSMWIAGLIAAVVALLIGLILTHQITKPVHAVIQGARQIAKGDLAYRVDVKSGGELGDLAQSFNKMALGLDMSEQSRKQLNADIAHELRTPVTVIEGTVDGILDGVFEADREHLESIKEQTHLLAMLTHDLRDLSLAESGQLILECAPTNMKGLIERKLLQYEMKAREKDVSLKLNVSPGLPEINIDPVRIEQVVANLMTNAIRHTMEGGSITINLETITGDSTHNIGKPSLIISFTDTGKGIAPEHLPYVFERFYRVDSSRSRSEGGAGLGLAIVKQIVQAHGGQVWVESEVNKGSVFYIAFPFANA